SLRAPSACPTGPPPTPAAAPAATSLRARAPQKGPARAPRRGPRLGAPPLRTSPVPAPHITLRCSTEVLLPSVQGGSSSCRSPFPQGSAAAVLAGRHPSAAAPPPRPGGASPLPADDGGDQARGRERSRRREPW